MLQFISFGSGSCGNCSYLTNGRDAVLIDAGVGIRRLKRFLREYGLKTNIIRGLLITHDHADHIKAAGYVSSEYNLRVYSTARIHEGMRHNYHAMRKVEPERNVDVEKDVPFELGSLKVTAFDLPHDSTENVGYCIESDGEVFTMMTDVGAPTENVCKYIERSHYLVIETNYDAEMLQSGPYPLFLKKRIVSGTGHLSNAQTAQVLADHFHEGLKNVWLCHLSEENNHPELARKTVEYTLRQYGIIAGKDFQLEVLRRGVPTGPWWLGKDYIEPEPTLFKQVEWKGALFDLDGTLFDTEGQYSEFWGAVGRKYHPEMPDFEQVIKGTTLTQIFGRYFPDPDLQHEIQQELDAWEAQMDYRFMPGAERFIEELRQHGVKCAVVTSSNIPKMKSVRRRVPNFDKMFDRVLTAEDFSASKPAPDCYLLGAKVFGLSTDECIVFEDALTGIEAGTSADIMTVGFATTCSREVIEDKCDAVFNSFTEINYDKMKALFNTFHGQ